MEKILFIINKRDTSLYNTASNVTVVSLNTLDEIFSTPYFQTNKNSIVHLTINSKDQLDNILMKKSLDKINLPILFHLETSEPTCIDNLLHLHYTNIFTIDQPAYLLIKYVDYMFNNYHLFVTQKSNKLLKDLDTKLLTKKELEIIKVLAESPKRELHRDEIYIKIWGSSDFNTNTLDVHLCNLRRKLKLSNMTLPNTENGKVALKERVLVNS
jgi:hypothetical protein